MKATHLLTPLLLSLLLVLPSAAAFDPTDGPLEDGVSDGVSLAQCGSKGAVPVTGQLGTEQNWAQFWQDADAVSGAVSGAVYVSWAMTSGMSIGSDRYVFAAHVNNDGESASFTSAGSYSISGTCQRVGTIAGGDFKFWVTGGSEGWQGSDACTSTHYWEVVVEAELKVDVRLSGSVKSTVTFGGSTSCTSSTTYDSEILIGEKGTSAGVGGTYISTPCLSCPIQSL